MTFFQIIDFESNVKVNCIIKIQSGYFTSDGKPFYFFDRKYSFWHNVSLLCLDGNNLFVFKVWLLSQRQSKENDSSCMDCKVHFISITCFDVDDAGRTQIALSVKMDC